MIPSVRACLRGSRYRFTRAVVCGDVTGAVPGMVQCHQPTRKFTSEEKQRPRRLIVDTTGLQMRSMRDNDLPSDNSVDDNKKHAPRDANADLRANLAKEEPNQLVQELKSLIDMRGPITLHEYMMQTVSHSVHGYYRQRKDIIGESGDFVTAPEISQLFGESIAVWLISTWESLGSPNSINIVEMGPGKGTLMQDICRVANKFPKFRRAMQISFIEMSDHLRSKQFDALKCKEKSVDFATDTLKAKTTQGIPVSWYKFLDEIPTGPALFIGQEFLDAFPVHQFVYTNAGWREKLVDIDNSVENKEHFRFVVSPMATPAVNAILNSTGQLANRTMEKVKSMAKDPNSQATSEAAKETTDTAESQLKSGDGIEIAPLALATCEDVAIRIKKQGGAALFIDYGENFTQEDSVRGYRGHKQENIFKEPGTVDVTADVDFSACCRVAAKKGVKVYDVVPQGEFLISMGAAERLEQLIAPDDVSEVQAEKMVNGFEYLVSDQYMGKRFKVMAFSQGSINVAGFKPVAAPAVAETEDKSKQPPKLIL